MKKLDASPHIDEIHRFCEFASKIFATDETLN
jgi:hypothetical protein